MIRFLFKQAQPRRFTYQPRFYNETREYLEARKSAIRRTVEAERSDQDAEELREQLHHSWRSGQRRRGTATSNRNVMIIFAILLALAYLVLR